MIDGQGEFEMHTDIDVTFTMSALSDTGLTFGASIELDESDGDDSEGSSATFDSRKQGGEEVFISGAFGTLTMGDTDGALDWALQDIGIGGSLGDAHTTHLGYMGNDFADGGEDGEFMGLGLAYTMGDWVFAANYGQVVEREPFDRGQEGYGIAVNYDLGGGAEMQLGYSNSSCRKFAVDANGNILSGGALTEDATIKCRSGIVDNDYSAISFGVAMNFRSIRIYRQEGGPAGSP